MNDPTSLREALLDLGLEDLIPLREIATADEVRGVLGSRTVEEVAAALVELLHEGRIQVWSGPWPEEPQVVDAATAEKLLGVEQQYVPNSPADRRERVYYVNVDSLRSVGEQP